MQRDNNAFTGRAPATVKCGHPVALLSNKPVTLLFSVSIVASRQPPTIGWLGHSGAMDYRPVFRKPSALLFFASLAKPYEAMNSFFRIIDGKTVIDIVIFITASSCVNNPHRCPERCSPTAVPGVVRVRPSAVSRPIQQLVQSSTIKFLADEEDCRNLTNRRRNAKRCRIVM